MFSFNIEKIQEIIVQNSEYSSLFKIIKCNLTDYAEQMQKWDLRRQKVLQVIPALLNVLSVLGYI